MSTSIDIEALAADIGKSYRLLCEACRSGLPCDDHPIPEEERAAPFARVRVKPAYAAAVEVECPTCGDEPDEDCELCEGCGVVPEELGDG